MKEEIESIREEVQKVKEKSFAMEILTDYKRANKRLFILLLITIIMWFASIGLFTYYIMNYGFEITTEEAETTDGGNACVGDNCNNGVING